MENEIQITEVQELIEAAKVLKRTDEPVIRLAQSYLQIVNQNAVMRKALTDVAAKLAPFGRYKTVADAIGMTRCGEPDSEWCYVCDRPGDDCACALDPNGPLPQSACLSAGKPGGR